MLSSSTARVDDLPEPAAPVTSTIPSRNFVTSDNCCGNRKRRKIWNDGRNHAHHHRTTAALNKNIHAKPGQARQSKRNVASPVLAQRGDGLLVVANQIGGDVTRVVRGQKREPRHLHRDHLAIDLNLRRTARRKNQIADFFGGAQHGAEQSRSRDSAASGEAF